ncbi:hypothetical protein SH661x_001440 [Planctomicrobium sp. SH661]|uniref:hypothetical protein n=1 Tax=Planctomicrobium sp. SH661 TaxID=3448124 RepID=UPI003F5BB4D4
MTRWTIMKTVTGSVNLKWIFILTALCGLMSSCNRAPQVVADPAVFKELDALYTAVTARRSDLLQASQLRIGELHENKQLSDTGFHQISGIVQLAERGDWQDASEKLYHFMRAQRKSKSG